VSTLPDLPDDEGQGDFVKTTDKPSISVLRPNRGGILVINGKDVAWTGGDPYGPETGRRPVGPACHREQDSSQAAKIAKVCKEGLTAEQKLTYVDTSKATPQTAEAARSATETNSLAQWMINVGLHITTNGMDAVFYARHPRTNAKVNLLNEWSSMTVPEVIAWYKDKRRMWDNYDMDNIRWSAQFLEKSVSEKVYKRVAFATQGLKIGPVLYVAIVRDIQKTGSTAARLIVNEIAKLKITDIPGENVNTLINIIWEYCSRLEGIRSTPPDLAGTVAACLQDTCTGAFNVKAMDVLERAEDYELTWQEVLTELQNQYNRLDGNHQWKAKHPLADSAAVQALKAEITNSILGQLRRTPDTKSSGSNGSAGGNGGNTRTITCHRCKATGHYARDCPTKGKAKTGGGNKGTGGNNKSKGAANPLRVKPGDGESKVKTINGVEHSWCDRCGRWTSGEKRHSTAEHRTREEIKNGSGKKSTTFGETTTLGGGLAMHFHGAGHV
jgi:hypothetical protein